MSSRELSNDEIKLLERGLKFTPTPKQNTSELKTDIHEFNRKIRLLEYFNDRKPNEDDGSLVKNPSDFVPPKSEDKFLNTFFEATTNYHKLDTTSKKSNISRGEQCALSSLKNDDSIIIKQADKGGATVIMDRTFYREKIYEMLADKEHYTELTDVDYDNKIMKKIGKHIKKFDKETTKKEKDYLEKFTWKTSNFYGLPKIHKSEAVKNAIQEQNATYIKLQAPPDLKLRPIVAGPASPTHRLSNFIDIVLKPFMSACTKLHSR